MFYSVLFREPLTALVQETISGVNSIVLSPNDTIRTHLGNMLVDSASRGQDEMYVLYNLRSERLFFYHCLIELRLITFHLINDVDITFQSTIDKKMKESDVEC